VKIPWDGENQLGKQIHLFLESWFHPRGKGFHGGIKKLPPRVLGSPPRWDLREERWRNRWRGKFCPGGLNSWKPDSPVLPEQTKASNGCTSFLRRFKSIWRHEKQG
jgi:hypothetical protein